MNRPFAWLTSCVLALSVMLPLASMGQNERILRFDSRIEVQSDASLVVTETIVVTAAGQEIKRGIYRDFPLVYGGRWGLRKRTGFEVVSVLRDGKPEPYRTENRNNGKRVYFGSASVFLKPGKHTYEWTYRTDRQLGFFESHDELYWNVTGNGWVFPIDQATAVVRLPPGCPVLSTEAYTGPQDAKGRSYTVSQPGDGTVQYATTAPLNAREGFTIVAAWPKGHVAAPDSRQMVLDLVRDNAGLALALLGLVLVLVYYALVWSYVGRDPEKGVIIPRYEPPKGVSPAGVRYLMRMGGYDHTCFAANIISLAVKGGLTIRKVGKEFTLAWKSSGGTTLTPDESALFKALLGSRKDMVLKQSNHSTIQAANSTLGKQLALLFEKRHFLKNTRFWVPGLLFSLVPCAVSLLDSRELAGALFMLVWLSFWTVGVTVLLSVVWSLWRSRQWLQAIPITLFSIPFVAGELFGLWFFSQATSAWAPVIFALGALINGIFYHLLKAPTVTGRKTMDEIEGFKLYLSVAEKDRLNLENPPQRTPELFEMFLPYALALGVEQRWSEQFKDVLEAASREGETYSPAWYTGAALGGLTTGAFAGSLGSSLSSAIASSSTAPGSSSGSSSFGGGGGSSGGGGGGGGGGGW